MRGARWRSGSAGRRLAALVAFALVLVALPDPPAGAEFRGSDVVDNISPESQLAGETRYYDRHSLSRYALDFDQAPAPEAQPREPGLAPTDESPGHEPQDGATPPVTPERGLPPEPKHSSDLERQFDPGGSAAEPRQPTPGAATSPASAGAKPDSAPAPEAPRHRRQREAKRAVTSGGMQVRAAPNREPGSDSKPDRKTAGGTAQAKSSRVTGAVGAGSRSEPGADQHDGEVAERSRERPETGAGAARDDATAARAERVHEVQSGESLWAIAARRVGPRATDAEIAAEVNRLWELNDTEVIRTGNPDLILPGQRLRL